MIANSYTISNIMLDYSFAERIGLTIVHSFWQIALVAFAFGAIKSILVRRNQSANTIYITAMTALIFAAALPCLTFTLVQPRRALPSAMTIGAETRNELAIEMVSGSSESAFLLLDSPVQRAEQELVVVDPADIGRGNFKSRTSNALWSIASWLPNHSLKFLSAFWCMGVLLFSLRTLIGLLAVRNLKTDETKSQPNPLLSIAQRAAARFPTLKSIPVSISAKVDVPLVIGFLRPVILLPVSVLAELSAAQLELIIVHELAHIRRRDFLMNLIQTTIESLLFFHPCVWWISKVIREERENCCDDAAVAHGNAQNYTKALLKLEQSRTDPALAMSASGSNLLSRIRRLAKVDSPHQGKSLSGSWLTGIICLSLLSAIFAFSQTETAIAQEPESDFQQVSIKKDYAATAIGKVLDREMDKLKQVGFSGCVLVAHEGEIILTRSEGLVDDRKKGKIRPSTLFEIASATKCFTATAAMILAQQGKLDLDASISKYLPSVPRASKKIRVLDLMLHESGMPATNYGDTSKDLKTAVRTMLTGGPKHDPGTNFEYWNQGYILLSEIITKAAGEPYVDFVRHEIFEPCGMSGTCFNGDKVPTGFKASIGTGTLGAPRSCLEHPYGKMDLVYQGTGGIVTNVVDMWKFHQGLMDNTLLDDEFKELMFEKGASYYACGWNVRKATNGETKRHHGGKVRGFVCEFSCFPESDSCIVVLANSDTSPVGMVSNVIEGLLLPVEKRGEPLAKAMEKKIIGEYKDAKDRMLIVLAGEDDIPTQYMIYWQPKNPSAPISRGSVLRDKDGEILFYQPGESDIVDVKFKKDKSQADSIRFRNPEMEFKRFDIEAWSKSQRK